MARCGTVASGSRPRTAAGRASGSSRLAEHRERPARRDRLGRVGGEQLDALAEPLELLVRREEADADPERVEARRWSARSRTSAGRAPRAPRPRASRRSVNVTSVAIRSGGVSTRHARDAPRAGAPRDRGRRAAPVDEVQADEHRHPADRAGHPDDGRAVEHRPLESAGVGPPLGGPLPVHPLEVEPAGDGRGQALDGARARRRGRPSPRVRAATSGRASRRSPRPRSSNRVGMAPAACAPSTTTSAPRAWAISAIAATGRTAPVVQATCDSDDEPGAGRDRGIEGGDRPRVVAVIADVEDLERGRARDRAGRTADRGRPGARRGS